MESPADGTHFMRFYLNLPFGVFKSNVGLAPGTRLFFGTTLWETEALPRLREETRRLGAAIDGYNERRASKSWLQRFGSSFVGYNKYLQAVTALERIGAIGSPGTSEGVMLGTFTASKEGYVGIQGGRRGRQFGQVGTFSIRRSRGISSATTVEDRELVH